MITQKDKKLLAQLLQEILQDELISTAKSLERFNASVSKKLDSLQIKLDKFLSILERYERKQKILEKKIEAIEDYFDPHPHN